jgi:hypothetical protein
MGRAYLSNAQAQGEPPKAVLVGWQRGQEGKMVPRGEHIGWTDGHEVFLDPDAATVMAQKVAKDVGENIGFKRRALYRELHNAGLIRSANKDRHVLSRQIQGRRVQVLHMNLETFIGEFEHRA